VKVYIVVSKVEFDYDDEELEVIDIEAVFTNIKDAARYIISHEHKPEKLSIETYDVDYVTYISDEQPKKIVMGKYFLRSQFLKKEKVVYSYHCCEEIIEKEDCVLLSTTVPVETSGSEEFEKLDEKRQQWIKQKKTYEEEV
jgi:hypothetical protein